MTMPGDYSEELVELVARTLWDECRRELGSHLKDEPSGTCFTDARAILDALSSAGRLVPEGSEVREEYVVTGVDEEGGRWISFPQSMKQAEHALASFGGRLGVRRVITTPATPWTPLRARSGGAMKRADLTTALILGAVRDHGVHAWEALISDYPPKLVLAAMEREVDADRLDYGVTLRRPFLTAKGRGELEVPSGLSRESNPGSTERTTP